MSVQSLIAAVDIEDGGADIGQAASALAAQLGAKLTLLYVLPVKPSVDVDVLINPAAHPVEAASMRDEEKKAVPALQALAQLLSTTAPVALRIAHGDIAEAVLEVARDIKADMIVVGTHGRRGALRWALGSVAETVVRRASVPVVTLRGGAPSERIQVVHHEVPLSEDGKV